MTERDSSEGNVAKPNLFIVGSMKCGTTALYRFLTRHSKISGSKQKEVHYFTMHKALGPDWYLSNFEPTDETKYVLDASPTYFDLADDPELPRRIFEYNPDSRIIILVRDPLSRSISHFHHLRTVNKIAELQDLTFTQFIRREWPTNLDLRILEQNLSYVLGFSFYFKKIKNFSAAFGKDNVFLIENERLQTDGPLVVNELLHRLGLEHLPDSILSQKVFVGAEKLSEDTVENSELFRLQYGDDYKETLSTTLATRL